MVYHNLYSNIQYKLATLHIHHIMYPTLYDSLYTTLYPIQHHTQHPTICPTLTISYVYAIYILPNSQL